TGVLFPKPNDRVREKAISSLLYLPPSHSCLVSSADTRERVFPFRNICS
ncbi:hypothetical protein TNCV_3172731, partial [Trichonephila clavipes]